MKLCKVVCWIIVGVCTFADALDVEAQEIISHKIAVANVEQSLFCSEDFFKALELRVDEQHYLIPLDELSETPVIHGNTVCRIFLRDWFAALRAKGENYIKFELRELESKESKRRFRIVSENFYDNCVELGYCYRDVFDFLDLKQELRVCRPQESLTTILARMKPRIMRPTFSRIEKVSVELFPVVPLSEKLKEVVLSDSTATTLSTTMTIGGTTALEYSRAFRTIANDVVIGVDAGILFGTGQGRSIAKLFAKHPTVSILPITSGVEFRTIHHWKFIVNSNSDRSSLSSMNLSTPLKSAFTDFVYTFEEPAVSSELKQLLSGAFEAQCRKYKDFDCFAEFATSTKDGKNDLLKMFTKACNVFRRQKSKFTKSAVGKKYFLQPQDTDLQHIVRELIDSADKEVIILSHKFTLSAVLDSLKNAAKRGVKIYLLTSRPPRKKDEQALPFFYFPARATAPRRILEPHMKTLVVDGKTMFFGTGNFTKNAFVDARELFAVTQDLEAISEVRKVAGALLNQYHPKDNLLGLGDESEPLVLTFESEEPRQKCLLEASLKPVSKPWMKNYRRVEPEYLVRLKSCGLSHLKFVSVREFSDCICRNPV